MSRQSKPGFTAGLSMPFASLPKSFKKYSILAMAWQL